MSHPGFRSLLSTQTLLMIVTGVCHRLAGNRDSTEQHIKTLNIATHLYVIVIPR